MATLATWAGVDRDRRMYLGRWCVVETADEYVRSASYVVYALQVHVVRQLCADPQLLEVGMDEFEAATRASHGGILQGSERLRLPAYWGLWRLARLPAPPTRGLPEVPQPVEEPGPEEGAKFFVSVLGKRGLCVKGCGLVPGALARVEYLQTTEGAQYDWACRRCFPPKAPVRRTRARPRFTQRSEQKAALEQVGLGSDGMSWTGHAECLLEGSVALCVPPFMRNVQH